MSDPVALLRRAYAQIEKLQARLEAGERGGGEPIAIVGMGCRFPGHSDNPDAFWRTLQNGVDGIVEIPAARWPQPSDGIRGVRWAGLLDSELVSGFDAAFFGISPREVE